MERGNITINRNGVSITGNVRMADYEIAELFGVTLSAVNSNIKLIYKIGAIQKDDTYQYIRLENGNRADTYNMEVITALAFLLKSLPAKVFRDWIIRKAVKPAQPYTHIILGINDSTQN